MASSEGGVKEGVEGADVGVLTTEVSAGLDGMR